MKEKLLADEQEAVFQALFLPERRLPAAPSLSIILSLAARAALRSTAGLLKPTVFSAARSCNCGAETMCGKQMELCERGLCGELFNLLTD